MSCPFGSNYKLKCRCDYCRAVKREIQRVYRLRKAQQYHGYQSDKDLVPADAAKARVRDARKHGATFAELAVMTGIRAEQLQSLVNSTPRRKSPGRVRRATANKIMEGIPDYDSRTFLPTSKVPLDKARQICASLSAQGWTCDHQREIIERHHPGMTASFVHHLTAEGRTGLLKKNEDLMLWLEKAIGNKIGPSKKGATYMTNRGYFPTRHYNAYGKLIKATLSREQKAILERVQS